MSFGIGPDEHPQNVSKPTDGGDFYILPSSWTTSSDSTSTTITTTGTLYIADLSDISWGSTADHLLINTTAVADTTTIIPNVGSLGYTIMNTSGENLVIGADDLGDTPSLREHFRNLYEQTSYGGGLKLIDVTADRIAAQAPVIDMRTKARLVAAYPT